MKQIRVTPLRLARHDFNTALRSLRKTLPDEEIFAKLSEQKKIKNATFSKSSLFAAALFLIIAMSQYDGFIEISAPYAKISIPKLYLVFLCSLMTGFSIIECISYLLINDFHRIASNRMFGNNILSQTRAIVYDAQGSFGLLLPMQYRLMSGSRVYSFSANLIPILTIVPILIIYISLYVFLTSFIIKYIFGYNYLFMGDVFSIVGLTALYLPIVTAALIFTPFMMHKNTYHIRWGFLTKIYRRSGDWAPRSDAWIAEGKKNSNSGDGRVTDHDS